MDNASDLTQFIGRWHIVVLHLPIGLLSLLGILELLSMVPRWRHATLSNPFILALVVPATLLTAACGWLLGGAGGYDEQLLGLHRWTGVAVAVAACALFVVHRSGRMKTYRVLVFGTLGLTMVTGHLGGSLTHGSDYLTRYAPFLRSPGPGAAPGGGAGFAAVEPVLTDYCIRCHGPEKSKGGLRMDTREALLAGGDSGPVLVPGDVKASLLVKLMELPLDDDDHMPPAGKPQPTEPEARQLRDWIQSGAPE